MIVIHVDSASEAGCLLKTVRSEESICSYAGPTIEKGHSPHHNRFTALFPGPTGWSSVRRELLDFVVQGKINRGRHTNHPAGCHSIRANQCPTPPSPRFLQAGCPSCRPTNRVKALKSKRKRTLRKMKTTGKATGNHPGKYLISETVSMQPRHSSMYRQPSRPLTWSITPRHDMLKNVINLPVTAEH